MQTADARTLAALAQMRGFRGAELCAKTGRQLPQNGKPLLRRAVAEHEDDLPLLCAAQHARAAAPQMPIDARRKLRQPFAGDAVPIRIHADADGRVAAVRQIAVLQKRGNIQLLLPRAQERIVERRRHFDRLLLLLDDGKADDPHDLRHADLPRHLKHRKALFVGKIQHILPDLLDIRADIDDDAACAVAPDLLDQTAQRERVAQAQSGGEHQLLSLQKGGNRVAVHHMRPHDLVIEPGFPRHQLHFQMLYLLYDVTQQHDLHRLSEWNERSVTGAATDRK